MADKAPWESAPSPVPLLMAEIEGEVEMTAQREVDQERSGRAGHIMLYGLNVTLALEFERPGVKFHHERPHFPIARTMPDPPPSRPATPPLWHKVQNEAFAAHVAQRLHAQAKAATPPSPQPSSNKAATPPSVNSDIASSPWSIHSDEGAAAEVEPEPPSSSSARVPQVMVLTCHAASESTMESKDSTIQANDSASGGDCQRTPAWKTTKELAKKE